MFTCFRFHCFTSKCVNSQINMPTKKLTLIDFFNKSECENSNLKNNNKLANVILNILC